jgi:hypothetical protein
MRLRARHVHAAETLFDNVVGYLMNVFLVVVVYNWIYGYGISLTDNVVGGIIFFIIAWARKYTIRRWANSFIKKLYDKYKAQEDAELQEQAGAVERSAS